MKKSRGNEDAFAGEIAAREGEKSKKRRTQSGGDEKEALDDVNAKRETVKRKSVDYCDLGAEEMSKKKKKKKKPIVVSELEENSETKKKRKKKKKPNKDSQSAESTKDAEKNQSVDSDGEGNVFNSMEDAKKKKKHREDPEAEGHVLNSMENAKKKKKNKHRGDPEAAENNNDATTFGKKKQKGTKSNQIELVRGKRFTKEEDELIKKAVLEYVEAHVLGDQGVDMVMNCSLHPQVKGCWKEITHALPWRPHSGVYHRAHSIFEEGSKGLWSKEDFELVKEHHKKHGNQWKTLADAMGKNRRHVRDAWRRMKFASKKKGRWSREEFQNLFDLVNKDLRRKAFHEKRSQHGMLRDNIPWTAISDQLITRENTTCCLKWYNYLTSPMVAKGIWANVDDYRLLDELTNLDAACVDDVDWDDLLDNRDGDACRSRWNQMVRHIGLPATKTFAQQVEIMSQRYCPDIAEDREDFDSRPYDD